MTEPIIENIDDTESSAVNQKTKSGRAELTTKSANEIIGQVIEARDWQSAKEIIDSLPNPYYSKEKWQTLIDQVKIGNEDAINQVIAHRLPILVKYIDKFGRLAKGHEADLLADGIGDIINTAQSINSEDLDGAGQPSYFFHKNLNQKFVESITRYAVPLSINPTNAEKLLDYFVFCEEYYTQFGRQPSDAEVMKQIFNSAESSYDQTARLLALKKLASVLQQGENSGHNTGDSVDVVSDPEDIEIVLKREFNEEELTFAINKLPDQRSKDVIASRFGLGGQVIKTLKELADELGLSRERIRQIEIRALEMLREFLSKKTR